MCRSFFSMVMLLIATFCCFTQDANGQDQQTNNPNILFIAVDDMNDWIGPLGGLPVAKTPNLDKLAQQGITLKNAHTACPACAPSRLSIMTGVQPHPNQM